MRSWAACAAMASRMPDANGGALRVTLDGAAGGVALAGEGTIAIDADGVALAAGDVAITLPLAGIDGVRWHDRTLTLHTSSGDVRATGAPRLAALARELIERACAIPELTRGLRSLGSHLAAPTAEHERFFAPLLDARRRAERSTEPRSRLAAFDAPILRDALEETLAAFALARSGGRPPERRALHAWLTEAAEPLDRGLEALEQLGERVRRAGADDLIARWREWAAGLEAVFVAADQSWLAMQPMLAGRRVVRVPLWRRLLSGR